MPNEISCDSNTTLDAHDATSELPADKIAKDVLALDHSYYITKSKKELKKNLDQCLDNLEKTKKQSRLV